MKNYIKLPSISLVIFLGASVGSFADISKEDSFGFFEIPKPTMFEQQNNKGKKLEEEIPSPNKSTNTLSWSSTIGGYVWSGTTNIADNLVRYGFAYGAVHLIDGASHLVGVNPFREVTALGVGCGGYVLGAAIPFSSGAVLGWGAYQATKTAFNACDYVPGLGNLVNTKLKMVYMPVVRFGTDKLLDMVVPTMASTGYSMGSSLISSGTSLAQSGFSSLSQRLYGQTT